MPNIGRLWVEIGGDTSGLERAVQSAQKTLGRAGNQMTAAGRALSLGLTAPIVAVGALAIKSSIDFETAFAGVRKTVDATGSQFDTLRKGIIDMSKEMPESAAAIAKVVETAGQLGIKTEGLLEFAKTMVMVGKTTDVTAEQAATGFARIANIMEVPQEQIKNLASAFVQLSNEGSSTGTEIIDMSLRIAGAGHAIGLTAPEVLAFSAGLADLGINAEAGGSAFSRLLIQMANAAAGIKPSEEALKKVADAQRDVRDAGEAMAASQRGVRDAQQGVVDAQRGVRDSLEGVSSAQRNSRNATESLRDAYSNLARAQRDQRQASLDARRETLSVAEAQQGLREVQAQAGNQALEIAAAQKALADAQRAGPKAVYEAQIRLNEAMRNGSNDTSAIRNAQRALNEARSEDHSLEIAQAQARLNQVLVQGPRYSLDLRNAQLRLEEAQLRVGQAAEQQKDKVKQAQTSVRNASEGLQDARRGERNANEGVSASNLQLQKAHEGVADAQIASRNAGEKLTEAQDKLTLANAQAYGTLQTFAEVAGMLPEEFANLVKTNPAAAINAFVEGLKKQQREGGNLFKIFEKLDITNIRQIDELLRMAVGSVNFAEKTAQATAETKKGTYIQDKYAEVTKTTAAQLEIMRNRVNANMIALGDELTPVLLQVTQNMGPLIGAFATMTALFAALPAPIQVGIIGLLGFVATVGPLLGTLGLMATGLKNIITFGPTFVRAMMLMRTGVMAFGTALITPPVGIVIALAALAIAIYIFRDDIWKVLGPALEYVAKVAKQAGEALMDGLGKAFSFAKNNWREIATLLSGPFLPLVALATDAFGIRSALINALTAVVNWIRTNWREIATLLSGPFAGIVALATDAFGIRSAVESGLRSAWNAISKFFSNLAKIKVKVNTTAGGLIPTGFGVTIPQFEKGTSYVTQDMLAQLHRGEMVLPRSVADTLRSARQPALSANNYNARLPSYEDHGAQGGNAGIGGLTFTGPVTVQNIGRRQDAKGALGDLGWGVRNALSKRGVYSGLR